MSYVPTTENDRREMLDAIGVARFDDLIAAVPADLRYPVLRLPASLTEMEIMRTLGDYAERNQDAMQYPCFLGAGAYDHFTSAVVRHTGLRGEFYTTYTPYQPEVSQGTLQVIYEFQTFMAQLYGAEVSNASMYDGATALAEAALMATYSTFQSSPHATGREGSRSNASTKRNRIVVADTVHPAYRTVMGTYTGGRGVEIVTAPIIGAGGMQVTTERVAPYLDESVAALVVQYPSFLGTIDDLRGLADAAHAVGALLVVSSYPVSLGMLTPPGAFGADVATGEAQCFGTGLSFGGPYLGVLTCKQSLVRLMPGRVVGQTTDTTGRPGYVLTLRTREQDIRREKATSNICTNEGLNALFATIQMSLLGDGGVRELARQCYHKAHYLAAEIGKLPRYTVRDPGGAWFHEFAVRTPLAPAEVNRRLLEAGFIGGYDLGRDYPELDGHLLLCATETKDRATLDRFVAALAAIGKG